MSVVSLLLESLLIVQDRIENVILLVILVMDSVILFASSGPDATTRNVPMTMTKTQVTGSRHAPGSLWLAP